MFGNKTEEIPYEEIGGLTIKSGIITISKVGAKKGFLGIGKEGVYSFPYASLGNARLFLALLAGVIGQEVPEESDQSAPAK
jgi:hypothetical protein